MQSRRPADADDRPPDYRHRFHAGNVGDVWKHCVLLAMLQRVASQPVQYLDTHAGEGSYPLGPTGEWTEGIGRVRSLATTPTVHESLAVQAYAAAVDALAPVSSRRYPGSPAFALATLGADARIHCWERDDDAVAALGAAVGTDGRVHVHHGDGLAALPAALDAAERAPGEIVVLIDPPYTAKSEWLAVPDALIAAVRQARRARFLLWYPVKSLTRPNAMITRLDAGGVSGTIAELITTPLELQRNRLNGSGVVLVRPPDGLLPAIAAAAPVLGPACATQAGAWSLRMRTWTSRGAE